MESSLKRNVFLKALEALVTIVASFLQLAIITRSYTPSLVGAYQLTLAWLFFVSALSCFGGILLVSTRELSRSPNNQRAAIFSSALLLQALTAVPLGVIAIITFRIFFTLIATPLIVGCLAFLVATMLQLSGALLVSKERIDKVVIASIAGHTVATGAVLIAARHGCDLSLLIGAWATYHIVHGIIVCLQSRAWEMISPTTISLAVLKTLAFEVLPVLVMIVAAHLYIRIDVILLDYFTNKAVVARYSAGYLFLDQLMILSNFMMSALFPNFARSTLTSGRDFQLLYRGILRLFTIYLLPVALLIAIFSKSLLGAIYGEDYAAAWPSLSILMLAAIFAWINGPSGTIFISLKKQHIYMWATLLSLLVNVVGNLILIPEIGAAGAAVSTVLTELAICAFCLYWIYRQTHYLPWMTPSCGPTGATLQ